jgi:nitrogen fixation NifU-like protein
METNNEFDAKLLKHFLNPHNIGVLLNNDAYARVKNPVNGYTTDLYLKIQDKKISDIRFKTFGCTVTIAAGSAITIILKNKDIRDIISQENPLQYLEKMLYQELGDIPEKNWHCIPTIINAVFSAFKDYYQREENFEYLSKIDEILDKIEDYIKNKIKE